MKRYVEKALKLRKWVKVGHHIPGRIRLKYEPGIAAQLVHLKSNDIENAIASVPVFKNYKLNSATGSIVIEYDASLLEPTWVDALFGSSEQDAESACYTIAERLTTNGDR